MSLINVNEAINKLTDNPISNNNCVNCIKDFLLKEPIVDAQPIIYGKWINCYIGTLLKERGKCSNCEYIQTFSNKLKYCPNCGAKMKI